MRSKSVLRHLPFATLLSTLAIGCATVSKQPPHDSKQTRPPVDQGGFVSHTEEITVQVPM
jgi:hypothetical protein